MVGVADTTGSLTHDAFLWKKGVMTDLGNLGLSSFGFAINSSGQVVGHSRINDGTFRAFIWEKGGPMVDLNTLVSPASNVVLVDPYYINDRGYIAVAGVLPNGDEHAFVLVPGGSCDDTLRGQNRREPNSSTSAQYLATSTRPANRASARIVSCAIDLRSIIAFRHSPRRHATSFGLFQSSPGLTRQPKLLQLAGEFRIIGHLEAGQKPAYRKCRRFHLMRQSVAIFSSHAVLDSHLMGARSI